MTDATSPYDLDDQIGYVLRRVTQRHLVLFSDAIPDLTTMQFAVLIRLAEQGPLSQNHLGRAVAMDAATVKGVVGRLTRQGLVTTTPDPLDRRRLTVTLTAQGTAQVQATIPAALTVTERTLAPLSPEDRATLRALLLRLV